VVLGTLAIADDAATDPPAPEDSPFTWGAVGDSITVGVGSSDPESTSYAADAGIPSRGWVGQCLVLNVCFWQPLVTSFSGELADLQQNRGVTGVVVEIGVNDLGRVTDQQYRHAYAEVVAAGAEQGVRVVLSTITPFGRGHSLTSAREEQRRRVNAWIRSQPDYVDFDAALADGRDQLKPSYDSGDGMHPSDAGHARMALALRTWINRDHVQPQPNE